MSFFLAQETAGRMTGIKIAMSLFLIIPKHAGFGTTKRTFKSFACFLIIDGITFQTYTVTTLITCQYS